MTADPPIPGRLLVRSAASADQILISTRLTNSSMPVAKLELSEARNTAALATSSGSPEEVRPTFEEMQPLEQLFLEVVSADFRCSAPLPTIPRFLNDTTAPGARLPSQFAGGPYLSRRNDLFRRPSA